jgi:hypothetical protein
MYEVRRMRVKAVELKSILVASTMTLARADRSGLHNESQQVGLLQAEMGSILV